MAENMTRKDVIKAMYQFEATEEDMMVVPDSQEVIHNWYIIAFPEIEALEKLFDIEDLYDAEPSYKVYVKDLYIP